MARQQLRASMHTAGQHRRSDAAQQDEQSYPGALKQV
jgi:hypothetical protein